MSIYDVLKKEHRKVEELIKKIENTTDADERFELFEQVRENLTAHSKAEERVFYSRLEKEPELKDQMTEAHEEHDAAELVLLQIEDIEPDSAQFLEKIRELKTLVLHHVEEEENQMFPRAKKLLGDDKDDVIAERYLRQEEREIEADEKRRTEDRPEA